MHWDLCRLHYFRGFFAVSFFLRFYLYIFLSHPVVHYLTLSKIQFGHAGASANAKSETAVAKNSALRDAGAIVPNSFDDLGHQIAKVY